jgi:hypothetical protein
MHYGDEEQLKKSKLELVIYKHEIVNQSIKRNKNGLLSKRCVNYEITSIKKCKYFNTRVLKQILEDPYNFFANSLDKYPFEEFILLKVQDTDGWGKIKVLDSKVVTDHANPLMTLH